MFSPFYAVKKTVRPRESGDPGRHMTESEVFVLDPRFRGDERSVWIAP
jgi:hypothetical protein